MIPFTRPDITEQEIEAVTTVLRSGWLTTGPVTARFEEALSGWTGGRTVCVSSATDALTLVLRLCGIGEGDEVIVPAYTYSATAAAVLHTGAKPVFADSGADCFHLTAGEVEKRLTKRTRAVILVDLGGVMADYDAVRGLLEQRPFEPRNEWEEMTGRPFLIADAAHSLGAVQNGVKSGQAADFSCFSFHAVKNLTTAEGGAVSWRLRGADDERIARAFSLMALHGQTRTALQKETGGCEYDILFPGWKCNMTDLAAAVGLSQLGRYDRMLLRRREAVDAYDRALVASGFWEGELYSLRHPVGSACHLFLALLPKEIAGARDQILSELRENGVTPNVHYRPLPLLSAYRALGYHAGDCPNAVGLYQREISLPLSSVLSKEEQKTVINIFLDRVERHLRSKTDAVKP